MSIMGLLDQAIPTLPSEGFVPSGLIPDMGPDDDDDAPPPPVDGPRCEVCARDIPWSGKGRKPKRCEDHKTRTREPSEPSARGIAATSKAKQARLDALVGDLQKGLGEFTATMLPMAPVTGATIALNGPDACEAIVKLAAPHPKFLEGLEKVAAVSPWISVGKFVASLMFAIMVDMNRIMPLGFAAESLGVAEAAERVNWQPPQNTIDGEATEGFTAPRPQRFKL